MSTTLYVEGGGDSKALRALCREGFRKFIERSGMRGRMPRIVACGGRRDAYDSFAIAHAMGDGRPMLLVDAEGPVTAAGPWEHLHSHDGWFRPGGAADDQAHLMVQVMESWFVADRQSLASFYGQGFNQDALPGNPNIEDVPRADALEGLAQATRRTRKGQYSKASHGFDILGALDPQRVEVAAPYARRFLDALRAQAREQA